MNSIRSIFMLICLLTGFTVGAQVVNVPGNAKEHFLKTYKNATDEKWSNNVTNYTVKFKQGNEVRRAHYKVDGVWDFTETMMTTTQIPEAVKESLSKSRFADWKLLSLTAVDNAKKEHLYRVEVSKGIQKEFVFYDKNGKEVKSNIKI